MEIKFAILRKQCHGKAFYPYATLDTPMLENYWVSPDQIVFDGVLTIMSRCILNYQSSRTGQFGETGVQKENKLNHLEI